MFVLFDVAFIWEEIAYFVVLCCLLFLLFRALVFKENKIYCIKKIIFEEKQVRSNKNLYQISKGNSKNHFTFFSQLFRNEGMYGNYVTDCFNGI